ncbi:MAG: ankyrin repeat domain-containing protein [Puniceicoccales bacterium]|jgi:ankyrin repeat protein|nr:ankyrin repeat domain-containing protein [Puniceicoccales bacterium]
MFRALMIFGVFFLASFWHFIQAEIAKDLQEPVGLSFLTGSGTAMESYMRKTQKLKESSSKIRKAWHDCVHMLTRSCPEDSKAYQTVKTLLEQYPDLVYVVDANGRNLLMDAVYQNNEEMIAFLIPHYVNAQLLDEQDIHGDSALFIAIRNQNKYAIALLLFCGARIDIPNLEGFDAIQFSCTLKSLEMLYFLRGILERLDELETQKESALTKIVYN